MYCIYKTLFTHLEQQQQQKQQQDQQEEHEERQEQNLVQNFNKLL